MRTDFRVPAIATADLVGRHGRRDGLAAASTCSPASTTTTQWTLHTHLKMEGSWRVYAPGERWGKAGHTARVVLDTGERVGVGFQLGIVELVLREHEDQVVGHLGPDLLGPDWDEHEAVRRLTADPDRPLGEALLDQRNLAGIGTIYRTEPCFLAGYARAPVAAVADPPGWSDLAPRLLLRQPPPPADHHHRRQAPRRAAVGLRPGGRAVPSLPAPRSGATSRARRRTTGRRSGARPASRRAAPS